jgi:bifunctional non-homologous end joining protein LigD
MRLVYARQVPPSEYRPQLATLTRTPPQGDEWIHEIKYDGYRIGCRILERGVALWSRNGKDWTGHFPGVAEAARALPTRDALLDGEIAMVLPDGRTSFQALQNVGKAAPDQTGSLVYFVFDLLRIDGTALTRLPLDARKARLRALVSPLGPNSCIRFADHVVGNGDQVFREACRLGLEGIIAKRRNQAYQAGRREGWFKIKCIQRQEFVIGGFTDPEGTRAGIGALLIGYYDASRLLIFAGKVGTGFTHKSALELRHQLDRIEQPGSPFVPPPPGALSRRAHWVKPSLVAEVAFTEWTGDGKIRHPSFQGLRSDKRAADVQRERPTRAVAAQMRAKTPRRANRESPGTMLRSTNGNRHMS